MIADGKTPIQIAATYVSAFLRTDALCKMLAKAGCPWDESDIKRANCETNTLPFTSGDILYLRKLMTDPEYSGLDRALDAHLNTMRQIPAGERLAYWRQWAKPIAERKRQIELDTKLQSEGLLFYRERTVSDYEEELCKA